MLLRQQGRTLVVHTPAKLNLFLEVLGKRTDGYHELETLMVSVGLYDTLRFTEEFASSSILYHQSTSRDERERFIKDCKTAGQFLRGHLFSARP